MPKVVQQRSWFWDYYHDHPSFRLGQGGTEGFFGAASGGKHKIYCRKCLDSHVAALAQEDKEAVELGQRMVARDNQQIETYRMSPSTYIMDFAPFRQLVIARAANKLVAVFWSSQRKVKSLTGQ